MPWPQVNLLIVPYYLLKNCLKSRVMLAHITCNMQQQWFYSGQGLLFYVILTSPPFPVGHYQKRQIASSVIREMLMFQSHTASLSHLDIMEITLKIQKVQDTRADLIKMIKLKFTYLVIWSLLQRGTHKCLSDEACLVTCICLRFRFLFKCYVIDSLKHTGTSFFIVSSCHPKSVSVLYECHNVI